MVSRRSARTMCQMLIRLLGVPSHRSQPRLQGRLRPGHQQQLRPPRFPQARAPESRSGDYEDKYGP